MPKPRKHLNDLRGLFVTEVARTPVAHHNRPTQRGVEDMVNLALGCFVLAVGCLVRHIDQREPLLVLHD